jgi:hypothetical protein
LLRKIFCALAVTLALVLAVPSGAEAKRVSIRADTWGNVIKVSVPSFPLPETFRLRVTYNTIYYFWNKSGTHYIAVFRRDACYTFLDGKSPSLLFDGMKTTASWQDDFWAINGGPFHDPNQGKQGCEHTLIPTKQRRWYPMWESPFWEAQGSIVWKGFRDQGFHWKMPDGSHFRHFHPSHDFIVQTTSIPGRYKIR